MAITMSLASAVDAEPALIGALTPGLPRSRPRAPFPASTPRCATSDGVGGTVTSETRTVPGIGSWAFIADAGGVEIVLWETAFTIG